MIQEAYLRVFEYCERGQVREPEKVLVRTVANLLMNEDRDLRRHRHAERALESVVADAAPSPEEAVAAKQKLRYVVNTLETVDPRAREAFLLHRMDGLSYPQIARQMGVSVSTIEKRIAWAMAVLLDATGRDGER